MTTSTAPFLSHLSDWPQYVAASTSVSSVSSTAYPINATSSDGAVENRQQQQDNNNSGDGGGGGGDDEDYNFFNHELSSSETTGPTAHSDADQTDIGDEIHLVC